MGTLLEDLRFGARPPWRSPGFSAVAILSLALGIGANTAIFSLIDTAMLRLLPVKSPQELVTLGGSFSYPRYQQMRDRSQVFAGIFAAETLEKLQMAFSSGDDTEQVPARIVSGSYFQVLGVNAWAAPSLLRTTRFPAAILSR
jgi:hypothetical protein